MACARIGAGGKGKGRACGTSMTFTVSVSGLARCQYGRVYRASGGAVTSKVAREFRPGVVALKLVRFAFQAGGRSSSIVFTSAGRALVVSAAKLKVVPGTAINAWSALSPSGTSATT